MRAEDVAERLAAVAAAQSVADAPQVEGQPFAQMAHDDLEARIGVEHPAQYEADTLRRGFHREAPAGAQYPRMLLDVILVVGLDNVGVGNCRMQVDRHVERLRALKDRPEPLIVEEEPVGQPVDHGTLEAELGDRALELVGRGLGIGGGERCKGGKPIRVGSHRFIKPVVGAARQWHCGLAVELLQPRHRMRQHLQIDAGLVHLPQSQFAEIVEALHRRRCGDRVQAARMPLHLGIVVMLLQGNDVGSCRHGSLHRRKLRIW